MYLHHDGNPIHSNETECSIESKYYHTQLRISPQERSPFIVLAHFAVVVPATSARPRGVAVGFVIVGQFGRAGNDVVYRFCIPDAWAVG